MTNDFFFECSVCGHKVNVTDTNPSVPTDMLSCDGCGHEFGEKRAIHSALFNAKAGEFHSVLSDLLSKAPMWE